MSVKSMRKLIDIGANLTDPMFRGVYNLSQKHMDDFEHMLARARQYGIEMMIVTGGSLKESREALGIALQDKNLFSTVGCHPTRCNEFVDHQGGSSEYLSQLKKLALDNKEKVVAIGETGLDYDRLHFCPRETQKIYFEHQLSLAHDTKLPLFLHNRNSTDDLIEILERNKSKFATSGGVVHSFDGSLSDLNRILDLGLYVGINGCSLKTEENLLVAKSIPSNRLMIETDCPWCEIRQSHASFKHVKTKFQKTKDASDINLPVKNRNEPMNLIQILEVLSDVRSENIDDLSEQIYTNTIELFFDKQQPGL